MRHKAYYGLGPLLLFAILLFNVLQSNAQDGAQAPVNLNPNRVLGKG